MHKDFLHSARHQFEYYKLLAEKTFDRLTDVFTTDGEKEWRMRDGELGEVIYIRQQPLTLTAAINRQLAHYPYHVGQIVFIG